jgi:ABC-type glycerol-3-phosphate transport system substrate-binding protein
MLHRVRRLTALGAVVVIASACSSGASSSNPGTASEAASAPASTSTTSSGSAASEAVTLNIWTVEGEEEFLPKIKDAFESSHPGTTLEFTTLPEDQYGTKIDTALAAGEPPDIAFIFDPRYIKQGHMVEVGEVLKERGVDLSRYAQGPLGPCTMDGKLYCMGTYTGALVLMYNKDIFDKAGIPYPSSTTPMTVDEYAALAKKLTVPSDDPAKKVWGGEAGPTYWWTDPVDFIGPDGHAVVGVLDDEPTIHTWDVLTGMVRDGTALSDDMVVSMGASSLLAAGQQAMSFEDNFLIGDLLEQGVNIGIAPLPVESAGEPAFVPSWTDAWSTFVTSEHPAQALDFITFMAKEGNVLREAGGAFPLDQQVAKDADYGADSPAKKQMLEVMGLTRPIPFVPGWFNVFGQLEDTFPQVVENGDSASALHAAAAVIQDDLAREWETWDGLK